MNLTFYSVILTTLGLTLFLAILLWIYHEAKISAFIRKELLKYRLEPKLGKYKNIEKSFRKDPDLGESLTLEELK